VTPRVSIATRTAASALLLVWLVALLVGTTGSPTGAASAAADGLDRIDAPADGASVSGVVEIRGRATGPDPSRFSYYRILIGEGKDPPNMRPLGSPYDKPVEDGVLATWNTDRFPSGEYTLLLQVYDVSNDFTSTARLVVVADKPTPTPVPSTGPVVFVTPVDVQEPAPATAPPSEPGAPSTGDGTIPLDLPTFESPPTLAPLPNAPGPTGPGVPINPIPINPDIPPPVRLDTPAQTDTSQLPFAPAPVYLTPIEFNP
jgi:hypothetical protein